MYIASYLIRMISYDVKGSAVRSIISDIVVDQAQKEIHFHYYA